MQPDMTFNNTSGIASFSRKPAQIPQEEEAEEELDKETLKELRKEKKKARKAAEKTDPSKANQQPKAPSKKIPHFL